MAYLLVILLSALFLAVNSQDRGTCFSNMGCTGTVTQSGLVEDLGEFCCPYSSPGVTMALSYQFIGSEHCFTCPRIIGFFDQDFRGEERANPHLLIVGILSGPLLDNFGLVGVTSSIGSGPNSASQADFGLTQTFIGLNAGQASVDYYVQHQVDAVAQENDEVYIIQLSNMLNLPAGITFRGVNITIVDSDMVAFLFNEADHNINEGDDNLVLVATIAKTAGRTLANPVTFNIFPITIPEARNRGVVIPQQADLVNDPRLPYEAIEADFNTTSFNVTFPADEGRIPITSVDVRVSIVDDNINERFEQLFLIGAEVVEATNPSTIDNSQRNVSIGIIDDNDDLVIGFNMSRFEFDEPDGIATQFIYLVKEGNKATEQTFDVQINFIPSTPEATRPKDFILDFFTPTVDKLITPDQKSIVIQMTVFADDIPEGNERFILESSPVGDPKYSIVQAGSTVFRSTVVIIRDNDPIIIGYEEQVYSLNETSSTTICIIVINPPLEDPLTISATLLTGPPTLITADSTDYSPPSPFFFVSSSAANSLLGRRVCSPVSASQDNILEDTEEVEFGLSRTGTSTDFIVLQPNSTKLLIFDRDVVTVGFIGAPYSVIESDGMASLTIGLIQGQLAVPVTLNVQLVDGSANASGDYLSTLSSSTVKLDGATSNVTITFPIVNDNIFELMESLSASLSLAQSGGYYSRVMVDPATAVVLIADNDGESGTCYKAEKCQHSNIPSGLVRNLKSYCCDYQSPGITNGYSYQQNGVEQCFSCPRVIGFFDQDFRGEERANPHLLIVGILSGPLLTNFGLVGVASSIGSGPNSASQADFALTQTFFGLNAGQAFIPYNVQHQVDAVAQENDEVYTIQLSNMINLPADVTFRGVNITIVDPDTVAFRFNEPDHSKNEGSDLILIASIAKTAGTTLANPVIFNIFPVTIPEARSRGVIIPWQADLVSDSRSPYEAVEADFNTTSFNVTFPADEGRSPITSVEVRVGIVDDNINERFEQLFLIGAEVVGATNPSAIENTQANVTIGIIVDNDDLVIGFNMSQFEFDEPDGIANQFIYLVKEGNKATEQTFDVQINFIPSTPEATRPRDFILDFFTPTVDKLITPDQKSIVIQMTVFADDIPEGNERFILESSPVDDPKYSIVQAGSTVFRSTVVVIRDNDPIIIGYEEPVYSLNETSSTTICIIVINPSLEDPLTISPIVLRGPPTLITAGSTDYSPTTLFFFVSSSAANSPLGRRVCSFIFASQDNILEHTEEVEFGLTRTGTSTDFIVLQPNRTKLLIFDQDVVTVAFIGAPYSVIESDGMASLTIGLIQGQLAVPVTLNVQLVDGSAKASGDYLSTLSNSTVTLDGATSNVTITFPIVNDNILELMENLSASLSLAQSGGYYSRVMVDPATAVVSIADDDVAVISQTQRGTCFANVGCTGTSTQSGLVDDLAEFCCPYSSPGVTIALSYQFFGIKQCFACPRIIGFFEQDFRGEERANPHLLTVGILSGPLLDNFGLVGVTASIGSGPNSASQADFGLTQTFIGLNAGQPSIPYNVQHQVDAVAQENDEVYTIQLSNMLNLPDDITFRGVNITIVDSDTVAFRFNEPDHSKNEGSDLILIASIAKTAGTTLANPVIFNIFPVTIPEARSRGVVIPRQADLVSDSRSPYEAVEADFNTTSFNVTFPADEGRSPITSVEVRVDIVDDNINERFEQLFLIGAEVVEATNPSAIDNTQTNVTIGIIVDNDDLVIGFNQSRFEFDEPEGLVNQFIYLVKEDDKPTEQTFDVQVNFIPSSPEAKTPEDFSINFILPRVDRQIAPNEKSVVIEITLRPDEIAEGNEQFILESSPVGDPKYSIVSNGSTVFRATTVVIRDNDPIIIGYEEPLYSVNEADSTIICISVTNPPLKDPLIISATFLSGPPTLITAGATDYSPTSLFFFVLSSAANFLFGRRACISVFAPQDNILENTEEVEFGLTRFGSSTDLVLQPNGTRLLIFDHDVVTVGFIGAPYFVIESDGMASLTIGLIQGQLAVPVTLNVQLVNGSAQASGDYLSTLSNSTVTLNGSTPNVTITFPIINDNIIELMESLSASLSLAQSGGYYSRVTVAPETAVVSIVDDDEKGERGTCYKAEKCQHSNISSGWVQNLTSYCCDYESPGITNGFSYQRNGVKECFSCPKVFGFFKRFRGQEATSSYTLQLGYLSGPLITTGDALVYVTATAGSGSTNASTSDFILKQNYVPLYCEEFNTSLLVEHVVDGVTEGEETYSLQITNLLGLRDYTMVGTTVTIFDDL